MLNFCIAFAHTTFYQGMPLLLRAFLSKAFNIILDTSFWSLYLMIVHLFSLWSVISYSKISIQFL